MELPIPVGEGQDGQAWSVSFEQVEGAVLEDYSIILDPKLPPIWSLAPDRLALPAE